MYIYLISIAVSICNRLDMEHGVEARSLNKIEAMHIYLIIKCCIISFVIH